MTLDQARVVLKSSRADCDAVIDAYRKGLVSDDAVRIERRKVREAISVWADLYRANPTATRGQ